MKQLTNPLMQNPVGAVVGGVAFYWGSAKYLKVSNTYARLAIAVAGLYVGAMAQKQISAMMSKPTAAAAK